MAQSARVFIVPDRIWGCQSLTGLPARCKAENERPPVTWMRPPCGSFTQLSELISNVSSSLPLKTSAGRCQCLAEISRRVAVSPVRRPSSIRAQLITAAAASAQRIQDFGPEVGRRARRSWPRLGGVDVTGNLSARPAERDVRGPGGAPPDSAAAGRHRGCHDRRDGDQLARVGRAAPPGRGVTSAGHVRAASCVPGSGRAWP